MTDRETLLALAERCEAGSGPDRRIDHAILLNALGWQRSDVEGWLVNPAGRTVLAIHQPRFTASLDAALSLVPEGRYWSVCNESQLAGKAEAEVGHHEKRGTALVAWCATPALALCAAALRARAEEARHG